MPLNAIHPGDPELYRSDAWRPAFARLRAEAPLHRCADSPYGPYWSVTTHALVTEVELRPAVFSNRADLGGIQLQDIAAGMDRPSFVAMDPPKHTPRRRVVAPMTNRSSLNGFTEVISERTARVLDALPRGETFDWVVLVATELTGMMLATMFDWPQARRRDLIHWSDVATANIQAADAPVRSEEARYAELQRMADVFAPLWAERRDGRDGFDLISMLANAEATRDMDREEFIGTLFLLIVGGNDTTRNSMSGGLLALDRNPVKWEKLRADAALVPNMVSEAIRWQTPDLHMRRTALAETEIAGQAIARGDKVVMWHVSANRDETVFEDATTSGSTGPTRGAICRSAPASTDASATSWPSCNSASFGRKCWTATSASRWWVSRSGSIPISSEGSPRYRSASRPETTGHSP